VKLDRFGRSALDTLTNVKTLELHGVRFICPSMGIDTDDRSPVGKFTLTIFAAVAELERAFIVERIQAHTTSRDAATPVDRQIAVTGTADNGCDSCTAGRRRDVPGLVPLQRPPCRA
jgi:hypothetical protein